MGFIVESVTLVRPFGHVLSFSVFLFIYHFACVIGRFINCGTGVYFYFYFTISLAFPLINLFCIRYTKLFLSEPKDKNIIIETH